MKMSPQTRAWNPIDLQSASSGPMTKPSERKNMKSTVPRRKNGSAVIKAFKTRQSYRYGACHVSQNATLLMEAHAHLTNGLQSKERLLLLFTDSLIIAKTKSLYLKLKACVRLSDIWLGSCIHIITDRKVTSKNSFVIGWPTTNYVATFSSSETKDRWLQALQWHTSGARQRVLPNAILLYVLLLCHPDDDSPATVAVAVDVSTTAENVVEYIQQQCKLMGEASDYQLCVNYEKEEETCTLIGHELPFFVLHHSLQSQQEHLHAPSEQLQEVFSAAQHTGATKTPHFTLKSRTHTPGILLKHKRKRSLIDWALRRGHFNQSDDHVEQHTASQKLFGQSLSSICPNGNLPKPITDLLYLLFCEGPETCGIFRRSANAKNCRILKERINSGKSFSLHKESVFISASLITEFLRELPGGVLCCDLYEDWMEVLQIEDQQHKLYKVRSLLSQLPEENVTLLCHLFGVLYRIHSHSHVNLMTATNLALCVAPNMLWKSSQIIPEQEGKNTLQVAQLIQYLIENTPSIFGEDLQSLFTRRLNSEQETHECTGDSYLHNSSSEDTDLDYFASPPLSPEVHPLFLPLATLSLKERRKPRLFHIDMRSSQGTYSCGTLDSITSHSSASVSMLGGGKLSQTRDRCLSEPSMYSAKPKMQIPTHSPVIRQSSCDAAAIEKSGGSMGLSPEQHLNNSSMGTRRRRYTFWKSPQIPSRFRHPAQKLASMSSLSSATTSSLSSLDSTLSLSSADPIPSPQDTQSRPFLFGAAAKLRPLTPEMTRKRWTNAFTYEEEEKVNTWGERDQEIKNDRELEASSHESGAERGESVDASSSNITEIKALQQCVLLSDCQSLAESVCSMVFAKNPLKSSDACRTEHDVNLQAISQKPCCIQTVPLAKQISNEKQETPVDAPAAAQRRIITEKENSDSCVNAHSKMHASSGHKVSRMKITLFDSVGKSMLKHCKVRDQTSKYVPIGKKQVVGQEFTKHVEGKGWESVPQTLFYGHDVPLCSAPSQQMALQVKTRCPSLEDVGMKDAGLGGGADVSTIINNSLSKGVEENTIRASKFAGTFRHTICINARNRGPAQNKPLP
ncbi:uncharacterized protein arhgap20b [Misgurnus anguillicaudatus]|uniref:uncharacterized protein arhgap20b n=1 Tax=Misgurnus anguillicaudatus TaxID=75329 RepID=UPI003CCFCB12